MSLVKKSKLESRISLQYQHLLQLTNTPHPDPNALLSLEQAIEQDYEQLNKLKDPNQAHETLDIAKNVPQARFGHTITMVNKYKVVLFGGATGDTGKYSMTGETFIFNMLLKAWTELNGK